MRSHTFTLEVKTHLLRKQAELAVLSAFASRNPDNCEITLNYTGPIWKDIKTAPRDKEILVLSKGFPWLVQWSDRFNGFATSSGHILDKPTKWFEIPNP